MKAVEFKGQTDVGFNTARQCWFLEYMTPTRVFVGMDMCNPGPRIKLKKVPIDTYSWKHESNEQITHGRIRFYDGNEVDVRRSSVLADSITISGKKEETTFYKVAAKEISVKYNLPRMTWTIKADGTEYETNHIVGIVDFEMNAPTIEDIVEAKKQGQEAMAKQRQKLRAEASNQVFLFSPMITIWGPTNLKTS